MKKPADRKDIGRRIALSGIGVAWCVVFISLGYFLSFMTLSFAVLASIGVMLPMTKGYFREGALTAVCSGVIGFFIVNVHIAPYLLMSGPYVFLTIFLAEKSFNAVVATILKALYSGLVFFVEYRLLGFIGIDLTKIRFLAKLDPTGLYAILNIAFMIGFLLYDTLLIQGFAQAKKIAAKALK